MCVIQREFTKTSHLLYLLQFAFLVKDDLLQLRRQAVGFVVKVTVLL